MTADFLLPSLGADMESARVVEWLVAVGDSVKSGDLIAVLETDKGAIDIEIFEDAVIEALVAPLDTELPVGAVLARVRSDAPAATEAPGAPTVTSTPAVAPVAKAPGPRGEAAAAGQTITPPAATPQAPPPPHPTSDGFVRASPYARRLAAERAIALETVAGSGPHGAVLADDLTERLAPEPRATRSPGQRGFDPLAMRRAIGKAMQRAKRDIPHYYLHKTIDIEPALDWLSERNARLSVAERLLPAVLLLRATAAALTRHPDFNGHFVDGEFVAADKINVGWAIALRGGGLVAPALPATNEGSLETLMTRLRDVVKRARNGGLRASELSRATTTVTSLGDRGAEVVQPVIYPPQVAIIGFGGIDRRPWIVGGGVAPRMVVTVSLAADHRVTDGHAGSRLLIEIEQCLQAPEAL